MTPKKVLIKLGGSSLENEALVTQLCKDLASLQVEGICPIVVHGGGPHINHELTLRGITWAFHEGQRITTREMIETIEMVLCGKVNRKIVRGLSAVGAQAIGVSGTDANLLFCKRAHPILQEVGEVVSVNTQLLSSLVSLKSPLIPVIAPIGIDENGCALNINADFAASHIAQAMGVEKLVYLTDQHGVLDTDKNLIPKLSSGAVKKLIDEKVVVGGMLAKTRAILSALQGGVKDVQILNANTPKILLESVIYGEALGTRITGEAS